ncbi:MAG TPA: prepilin-type N-terminal cleavage/methylation domain-containing protein [Caulobacteraceae bacterium]|nr:prepilin-type N-terminal cleavage/methylation domain-containing protein [Caulobacteraceae bacterium]
MSRRVRAARGFSLIEALVALIIAAISLAAVLELQRQLADGQARYERALLIAQLQRDALALTTAINPAAQPEGRVPLAAGRSLRWTAEPRSAMALNTGSAAAGRRFAMQLYRVDIQILDASGAQMGQIAVDRVGWRRLDRPEPYVPPPTPVAPPPKTPPTGPAEPVL